VLSLSGIEGSLGTHEQRYSFYLSGVQREGTGQIRQNEMVFEKALQIELNNITVPGEAEKAAALKALFTRYLATLHEVEKADPAYGCPSPIFTLRKFCAVSASEEHSG